MGNGGLGALRIIEAQDPACKEEVVDGFGELRNQSAPTDQQAVVYVSRLELCPRERVLERSENRARHEVVGLAGIEQITVEKRLQHLLELDHAQCWRLEAQGGTTTQGAGIDTRVFLDEIGALLVVTAEFLQTGDLAT